MRDTPQNQRESEVGSEKETDRVRAVKSKFRRGKEDIERGNLEKSQAVLQSGQREHYLIWKGRLSEEQAERGEGEERREAVTVCKLKQLYCHPTQGLRDLGQG